MKAIWLGASVAVGVALVATTGFLAAPAAHADSVPFVTAPQDAGSVNVSTAPGGYINVQVIARGVGVNQYHPTYCELYAGGRSGRFSLDLFGNGSGRIGPFPNGVYNVSGQCVDQAHMTQSGLFNQEVNVVIDGHPTTGGGGSTPAPLAQQQHPKDFNADCASADVYNSLSDALAVTPGPLKFIDPAAAIANMACALNIATYHGGVGNPEFGRRVCYAGKLVVDIVEGKAVDKVTGYELPVNWDFLHANPVHC